jgi:predicted nuclease of predicted toxin-antitoxin system
MRRLIRAVAHARARVCPIPQSFFWKSAFRRPISVSSLVFLVDECLHPSLVEVANEMGFAAHHVDRLGLKGTPDRQLLRRCEEQNLTLVTNNAIDFRKLYARAVIHSGLILILPALRPPKQRLIFRAALRAVMRRSDLINHVIELDQEGEAIILREFELPSL